MRGGVLAPRGLGVGDTTCTAMTTTRSPHGVPLTHGGVTQARGRSGHADAVSPPPRQGRWLSPTSRDASLTGWPARMRWQLLGPWRCWGSSGRMVTLGMSRGEGGGTRVSTLSALVPPPQRCHRIHLRCHLHGDLEPGFGTSPASCLRCCPATGCHLPAGGRYRGGDGTGDRGRGGRP